MRVDIKQFGSDLPAPMRYEDLDGDCAVLHVAQVREGEAEVENRKKRNVLVLVFKEGGEDRGLYLNVTQIKTMIERYGDDTDRWLNMPVPVIRTTADFQGSAHKKLAVAPTAEWDGWLKEANIKVPQPAAAPTAAGRGRSVSSGIRGMTRGKSGGK